MPKRYPTPWRAEFREMGGYDCMTDAVAIYDAHDNRIATLDCGDFGQDSCRDNPQAQRLARALGKRIVAAVNRE
jgi:hypothetical protein